MKKLLLGLFLLAALIAVSYLKMERDSEREAQAFIDGHDIGSRNAELAMIDVDSLEKLIDQKATGSSANSNSLRLTIPKFNSPNC